MEKNQESQSRDLRAELAVGSEEKKSIRVDLNSLESRDLPAKVWKY